MVVCFKKCVFYFEKKKQFLDPPKHFAPGAIAPLLPPPYAMPLIG